MSPRTTVEKIVYQLKITLHETKPPIWRRVLVTDDTSLSELHLVIQRTMGWSDSHLHQFIVFETFYSQPDFELDEYEDMEVEDEQAIKLSQLGLEPKDRFEYEYDFGDNWRHIITVEKVLERQDGMSYPQCIAGKRTCPPDDVGGVWGYENFLEIIRDKKHPEHKETLEWAGGSFDPEVFDKEEVNRELNYRFVSC